jgi:hypothetical protein
LRRRGWRKAAGRRRSCRVVDGMGIGKRGEEKREMWERISWGITSVVFGE